MTAPLVAIDTNCASYLFEERGEQLRIWHESGVIEIGACFRLFVETGPEKWKVEEADAFREKLGALVPPLRNLSEPWTLGVSCLGEAYLGSADGQSCEELSKIIFGQWPVPDVKKKDNSFFDVMHVSTAIDFKASLFVTQDGKILAAAEQIRDRFSLNVRCLRHAIEVLANPETQMLPCARPCMRH